MPPPSSAPKPQPSPLDASARGLVTVRPLPARVASARSFPLPDLTVLLALAVFLCLYQIGTPSFGSGDQTIHAKVIQEMWHSGDWLHPHFLDVPYYYKPPFKMWLTLLPISLFGETNFAYRCIDGMCGVSLAVLVFWFAWSELRSRTAAWLSALGLLSCHLLYYGHGVRIGVQDSLMVLLMSGGIIAGYRLVRDLLAMEPGSKLSRQIWAEAFAGGVFVGLGALTKNAPAYFAFAVVGIAVLIAGHAGPVLRRGWAPIVVALLISLALPAAYILAQGPNVGLAFQTLVVEEVMKRAAHSRRAGTEWMYWNVITRSRVTVPPELLFPSAMFALWMIVRRRDLRFAFFLSWALVPVVIQNLAHSRIIWYIMPALPGLSLVFGAGTGAALLAIGQRVVERTVKLGALPYGTLTCLFLGWGYTAGALVIPMYAIVDTFLSERDPNTAEAFAADILAAAKERSLPGIVMYRAPVLARPEWFYFRPLGIQTVPNDVESLRKRIASGEVRFVMTSDDQLAEIATLGRMTSYEIVPPSDMRSETLAIASFDERLMPRNFRSTTTECSLARDSAICRGAFGLAGTRALGETTVRLSSGSESGLLVTMSTLEQQLGTSVRLEIGAQQASGGALPVEVLVNARRVALLDNVLTGIHTRQFVVPPDVWHAGENLLVFRYLQPGETASGSDDGSGDSDRPAVMLGKLTFAFASKRVG